MLLLASSEERLAETTLVDLADIARHVATTSKEAIEDGDLEIRTNIAPAPVEGDPVLLERLVQNLFDNAIRYNIPERGWIAITTGMSNGHSEVAVENTGPDVPRHEIGDLFQPFRRLTSTDRLATSATSFPGRGAGLGLSIVRSVAHAHLGEVPANASPRGGLHVHVFIPAAPPQRGDCVALQAP